MQISETDWLNMQGAGAIMSAIGAWSSASSQRATLQSQSDISAINARMAERSAQSELMAGQRGVQAHRMSTAALKSTQRARMASSGVDLGEGSAAQVLTSTDVMSEIDANTIAANAVRSAWGYRVQATNYSNDANTSRAAAGGISPAVATATALLSSAGGVAERWYAMSKAGAFGQDGGRDEMFRANMSDDPIGALAASRRGR